MYIINDDKFMTLNMIITKLNDILEDRKFLNQGQIIKKLEPIVMQLQIIADSGRKTT